MNLNYHKTLFKDRRDAGIQLADKLSQFKNNSDVLVLALPRGGVPVAFEVAKFLKSPLDLIIVRKLGFPGQEELAIGAICSGGIRVINQSLVDSYHLSEELINEITHKEEIELSRREKLYESMVSHKTVNNKIIIVVDDGLATGATMRAAIKALTLMKPQKIIVAVPICSQTTLEEFQLDQDIENIICVATPQGFTGVGMWYQDFNQTQDEEVLSLLKIAKLGPK